MKIIIGDEALLADFERNKIKIQQQLNAMNRLIGSSNIKIQKRLYGCSYLHEEKYFDSEEELIQYIGNNELMTNSVCIIDFIGNFEGQKDVIRKTVSAKKTSPTRYTFYTRLDEENHVTYFAKKSEEENRPIWVVRQGNLHNIYMAFHARGILLVNDFCSKSNLEEDQSKLIPAGGKQKVKKF